MIKRDENKKRDTIASLRLCPHRGLLELSIFVIKITMHYILKIYLKKSILLLFFHIYIYIIPHFLIFFNSFIFFQKFQTKKYFHQFYSIKSIFLTTFQKII